MSQHTNSHTLGVLGCGAITEQYYAPTIRELQRLGRLSQVTFFDFSDARLALMQEIVPGSHTTKSEDALFDARPDVMVVASPVAFHAKQTVRALEAGCATLCEKPMATSAAEAQTMIDAGARADRPLAIGLFRRYFPAAKTVRQMIAAEALGKLLAFDFAEGGLFDWPARSDTLFRRETAGGGVLIDLGVHLVDLSFYWFGEPESIEYQDDAMGGVEANARLSLQYSSGVQGTLRLSRDWDTGNRCRIRFEKGELTWRIGAANEFEISYGNVEYGVKAQMHRLLEQGEVGPLADTYPQSFIAQLTNLLDHLDHGVQLLNSGHEGIKSLRLIERCYREKSLMTPPWFSPAEAQRAQEVSKL